MNYNLDNNIFGLDIGERALRLVQLKKRGKKILLASYNEVTLNPEIISNGQIQKEEELIKALNKLVKSANGSRVKTKKIITVLPEAKTFIKLIEISSPENKEDLPELVKEEVKNHIPLSLEEIYLDWQIISQKSGQIKLLIGAVPKDTADPYSATLEKSGLLPYVFEIEAAAITRSLLTKNDKGAKIIIDFGAVRTGLIIYDHQTVPFTVSLPISGNKITETITKTLKLNSEEAEKAKVVCGLDSKKCEGALLKILLQSMDDLTKQIKKAITFYKSNFPNSNEISEIILCGGGANFSSIDQVISEKLGIPAKIGNPFTNIIQSKKLTIPANKSLSYTTAIGLALRAFEKKDLL